METIQDKDPKLDREISMHGLTGSILHHTIRIKGEVKNKAITILNDSGGTTTSWIPKLLTRLPV